MKHEDDEAMVEKSHGHHHSLVSLEGFEDLLQVRV